MSERTDNGLPPGWQVAEPKPAPRGADAEAPASKPKRRAENGDAATQSQADRLVEMAHERYRLARTDKDEPFAVLHEGANIAKMLRGGGSGQSLRAELAYTYAKRTGRVPSSAALADALMVLEGAAASAPQEPVHLRLARAGDDVVLDLGDAEGRCAVIGDAGWEVRDCSPVLFRRTALTGPLPVPQRGGSLDQLRALMNVSPESWPLVCGWLMCALCPDRPVPILMLSGEQGTGKSTAARLITGLIDPGPAMLRMPPRDLEQWALSAAGSWIVTLDNISTMPDFLSDALCRAVTGEGFVKRMLYSDEGLSVTTFQRAIVLTSIDVAAMRGDLGERLLLVDLERIDRASRRTDEELRGAYERCRPAIIGAMLDMLSNVLCELPDVHLEEMPRLADAARIFGALDRVMGTNALAAFNGQADRIADDVVESDIVAEMLIGHLQRTPAFQGTIGQLLDALKPNPVPKPWPGSPRAMSGRLRRLSPALREKGVIVEPPSKTKSVGGKSARIWTISTDPERFGPGEAMLPAEEEEATPTVEDVPCPFEANPGTDAAPPTEAGE